jgi:hypothetical protein
LVLVTLGVLPVNSRESVEICVSGHSNTTKSRRNMRLPVPLVAAHLLERVSSLEVDLLLGESRVGSEFRNITKTVSRKLVSKHSEKDFRR